MVSLLIIITFFLRCLFMNLKISQCFASRKIDRSFIDRPNMLFSKPNIFHCSRDVVCHVVSISSKRMSQTFNLSFHMTFMWEYNTPFCDIILNLWRASKRIKSLLYSNGQYVRTKSSKHKTNVSGMSAVLNIFLAFLAILQQDVNVRASDTSDKTSRFFSALSLYKVELPVFLYSLKLIIKILSMLNSWLHTFSEFIFTRNL